MTDTRPFSFAVQGGPFDDPTKLCEHARRVEQLGYRGLFSSDHIGGVDPLLPLVVAGHATTTLRVGPLVLNNELHHPAILARTVATCDRLTGGRLTLGMGTGYMQAEHDAIGLQLRRPGPRVTRFGESLAVLRDLLDSGSSDHAGAHHRVALGDLGVRPVQGRVPILIGGQGSRVVALAGRFADIFQFTGLTWADGRTADTSGIGLESIRERARWLTEAAGERSRDIERSALVQIASVGADAPSIDEQATRFGVDQNLIADTPFALCGSLEQVIDKVERLRQDIGVSHYVVRDPEGFAPVVAALAGR